MKERENDMDSDDGKLSPNYRPTGECGGGDIKDAGVRTGLNSDTYGGNLDSGLQGNPSSISGDTGSDPMDECASKNKR